jgi:hypothetical protein
MEQNPHPYELPSEEAELTEFVLSDAYQARLAEEAAGDQVMLEALRNEAIHAVRAACHPEDTEVVTAWADSRRVLDMIRARNSGQTPGT